MKCTNCGNEIPDTAKVCGYCGHRLKEIIPSASISSVPLTVQPKVSGWIWAILALLAAIIGAVIIGIVVLSPRFGSVQIDLGNSPSTTIPSQMNPTATMTSQEVRPIPTASQKPDNTATSIIVEPFQSGETATKLSDLAKETGPDTWTANISSNTPVLLYWGWCTATQEILEQNLSHMQILFDVNGTDVTASMTQSLETIEGWVCRYYRGIVRSWPVGQHTILFKMIFLQKVSDGENDYEGETIKTYIINVSP